MEAGLPCGCASVYRPTGGPLPRPWPNRPPRRSPTGIQERAFWNEPIIIWLVRGWLDQATELPLMTHRQRQAERADVEAEIRQCRAAAIAAQLERAYPEAARRPGRPRSRRRRRHGGRTQPARL